MVRRVRTVDAHVGGEPLRLIVGGCPSPPGGTMLDKQRWAERRLDRLRRALMHEPRGHADMYGAVLTEPVRPGSDAGALFMHRLGFSAMCGHGVIGLVTIALERGLLHPRDGQSEVVLDVPAGLVRARPHRVGDRVEGVSFVNVPSFVFRPGLSVTLDGRRVRADVAFGGAFFAIVDGEEAGVALRPDQAPRLRTLGLAVKEAVEAMGPVVHPEEPALTGIDGTIFTGLPDSEEADLRNVAVFADGQIDRSPCGTGTAAVMAVLDAMGLLDPGRPFVHESLIGTRLRGMLEERTIVADRPAIRPRIEGRAWITGEHEFLLDPDDPLRAGFRF